MIWNIIIIAYIITSLIWTQHLMIKQARLDKEVRKWKGDMTHLIGDILNRLNSQERNPDIGQSVEGNSKIH